MSNAEGVRGIGEGGTKVTMTDTASKFTDGQIQWSGNILNIPQLRETSSSVLLRCDGETWNIATVEHDYELGCTPQEYVQRLLVEVPKEEKVTSGFPNFSALTGASSAVSIDVAKGLPYTLSVALDGIQKGKG